MLMDLGDGSVLQPFFIDAAHQAAVGKLARFGKVGLGPAVMPVDALQRIISHQFVHGVIAVNVHDVEPGLILERVDYLQIIGTAEHNVFFLGQEIVCRALRGEEEAGNPYVKVLFHKVNTGLGHDIQRMMHVLRMLTQVGKHPRAGQLLRDGEGAEDGLNKRNGHLLFLQMLFDLLSDHQRLSVVAERTRQFLQLAPLLYILNGELSLENHVIRGAEVVAAQPEVRGLEVPEGHQLDKVKLQVLGKAHLRFGQQDGILVGVGEVVPHAKGDLVHILALDCSHQAFFACHLHCCFSFLICGHKYMKTIYWWFPQSISCSFV